MYLLRREGSSVLRNPETSTGQQDCHPRKVLPDYETVLSFWITKNLPGNLIFCVDTVRRDHGPSVGYLDGDNSVEGTGNRGVTHSWSCEIPRRHSTTLLVHLSTDAFTTHHPVRHRTLRIGGLDLTQVSREAYKNVRVYKRLSFCFVRELAYNDEGRLERPL